MEAIYAIDLRSGLSKNGIIPWVSKKDMQFFVSKTKHHIVVMGINTFFSLPESVRPLKNRFNIVLTSRYREYNDLTGKYDNLIFTDNLETYLKTLPPRWRDQKVFIIGGKSVYEKYIPLCETVWVSKLKQDYSCDCIMNYDFAREGKWIQECVEEDDELAIYKYVASS